MKRINKKCLKINYIKGNGYNERKFANEIKTGKNEYYQKRIDEDYFKGYIVLVKLKNNGLVGIIDPQPIAGDCIYDYIFFIFSDLIFCKDMTMSQLYEELKDEPDEKINALVILILYIRR